MKRLIIIFLMIQCIGCREKSTDHPVFKYYPEKSLLREGYVSKYYNHFYPDNPDRRAATRIGYSKFTLLDENHYMLESYNAGFDLEEKRLYELLGDSVMLMEGYDINSYDVTDTTYLDIVSNTLSTWNSEKSPSFQTMYTFGDEDYIYQEDQLTVEDTTIGERVAKVFFSEWTYTQIRTDSIVNKGTSRSYYIEGLGFFESKTNGNTYSRHAELVEQMSVEEFEQRAGHNEHRVAWIDPDNTLSNDSDFKICGHERRIADYYNSTPDGRYIHNKRALLDTVRTNLDQSKLFNQSGRLVFRFVVNCEGEAGRFIAKGYDLGYQPMQFQQETIDHLFGLLQKLKKWRHVVIREEPRDAYFYITFNMIDGEITDILP